MKNSSACTSPVADFLTASPSLHNHHPKISFASFADLFAMIEEAFLGRSNPSFCYSDVRRPLSNGLLVRFQLLRMVIRILIFRGIPDSG